MHAAKAMAATACDVLTDAGLLTRARSDMRRSGRAGVYKSRFRTMSSRRSTCLVPQKRRDERLWLEWSHQSTKRAITTRVVLRCPSKTSAMPSIAPSLRRHLVEFARRVKLSGTPAELESFHYLEERMREYGFRTSLILHDAFISLPGTCSVEVDGRALRSITHSMSKPTGAAGIRAELVYIGAGRCCSVQGSREVAGRIALVDGIATEEVAHLASRAGAVGQLHISPTEHLYEMCISPVWGRPLAAHAQRAADHSCGNHLQG